MTKSQATSSPYDFSDAVIDALHDALAGAPDCEVELTAVTEALRAVGIVSSRVSSAPSQRQEAEVRLNRARAEVRKLSLRQELGESIAEELVAARSELKDATEAVDAMAADGDALAELLDERYERLDASVTALNQKLSPWRSAISANLKIVRDEARRTLGAVSLVESMFGAGRDPAEIYRGGLRRAPEFQLPGGADLAVSAMSRAMLALGRRTLS